MALSSDEIIKREIIKTLGYECGEITLRIFPEGSNDDQKLFSEGGLTFSYDGVDYGSCDAAWHINNTAVIALEGTDALNRGSSGNAQYQRFHHALGAVKNGLIGIYYLKQGKDIVQPDLYGMAYFASQVEDGYYLIIQDLNIVKDLLNLINNFGYPSDEVENYINTYLEDMYNIWKSSFDKKYKNSWNNFCNKRSTIVIGDTAIKYAGRMKRNFTDSSQRAGHIAVGEMYLTKYFFLDNDISNSVFDTTINNIYYLFLKTTSSDVDYLDENKMSDKEWYLLRNEPNVTIKTIDDLKGLNPDIKNKLLSIKDEPLKGDYLKIFNECKKEIVDGLKSGNIQL